MERFSIPDAHCVHLLLRTVPFMNPSFHRKRRQHQSKCHKYTHENYNRTLKSVAVYAVGVAIMKSLHFHNNSCLIINKNSVDDRIQTCIFSSRFRICPTDVLIELNDVNDLYGFRVRLPRNDGL